MPKYVLVAQSSSGGFFWNDYYTGKTYLHQHEYYAVTGGLTEAKRYTSKKRAEHACDALINKVGRIFVVEEDTLTQEDAETIRRNTVFLTKEEDV